MTEPNQEAEQQLSAELSQKIKHRRKFEVMDFRLAHVFLWTSIIASFASSIIVASSTSDKSPIFFAVIAGIPGLVILIDKTFDFKKEQFGAQCSELNWKTLKTTLTLKKATLI